MAATAAIMPASRRGIAPLVSNIRLMRKRRMCSAISGDVTCENGRIFNEDGNDASKHRSLPVLAVEVERQWGGRAGIFEEGYTLASRASGAVIGRDGDTGLLVTACHTHRDGSPLSLSTVAQDEQATDQSSRPIMLAVEYRTRAGVHGQIPSHATRRELQPTVRDQALMQRIDAALRPLLGSSGAEDEVVQVICTEISADEVGDAPALAVNSASLALGLAFGADKSRFTGPVGCIRVRAERPAGGGDLELIDFPDVDGTPLGERAPYPREELGAGDDQHQRATGSAVLDLLVAGNSQGGVLMLDMSTSEPVDEELVCRAIRFGVSKIPGVLESQLDYLQQGGVQIDQAPAADPRSAPPWEFIDSGLVDSVYDEALHVLTNGDAESTAACLSQARRRVVQRLEASCESRAHASRVAEHLVRVAAREGLWRNQRHEQRGAEEMRMMSAKIDVLHGAHGSVAFTQGRSACLATMTAAPLSLALQSSQEKGRHSFFAHLDLPVSASGELGHLGLSRRTVALGELVRRALQPVIPGEQDWPYVVRVSSEATAADGGSPAMAAVTACSMAMRSAGMPLSDLVVGVSLGLVTPTGFLRPGCSDHDANEEPLVLWDMDAGEERLSGMELQVAGTRDGITAMQLDSSCGAVGVNIDSLCCAVIASARARAGVLDFAEEKLKEHALQSDNGQANGSFKLASRIPHIETLRLEAGQVGKVIGPSGLRMQQLQELLGVDLVVDSEADLVHIYSHDVSAIEAAKRMIQQMFWKPEVGDAFDDCEVVSYSTSAALVRFSNNTLQGSVHVSELDIKRVDSLRDAAPIGAKLRLKVINVTDDGNIKLSRRVVMMDDFATMLQLQAEEEDCGANVLVDRLEKELVEEEKEEKEEGGREGGGEEEEAEIDLTQTDAELTEAASPQSPCMGQVSDQPKKVGRIVLNKLSSRCKKLSVKLEIELGYDLKRARKIFAKREKSLQKMCSKLGVLPEQLGPEQDIDLLCARVTESLTAELKKQESCLEYVQKHRGRAAALVVQHEIQRLEQTIPLLPRVIEDLVLLRRKQGWASALEDWVINQQQILKKESSTITVKFHDITRRGGLHMESELEALLTKQMLLWEERHHKYGAVKSKLLAKQHQQR